MAKSTVSLIERFFKYVQQPLVPNACWNWTGSLNKNGYGRFTFDGARHPAHRFAYSRLRGAIPTGMVVCHTCDNRRCVNPAHLWIGTQKENMQDCVRKGRLFAQLYPEQWSGEKHGQAKLTNAQVEEIRVRYAQGNIFQRELATEYGVSRSEIGNIVRGENWR